MKEGCYYNQVRPNKFHSRKVLDSLEADIFRSRKGQLPNNSFLNLNHVCFSVLANDDFAKIFPEYMTPKLALYTNQKSYLIVTRSASDVVFINMTHFVSLLGRRVFVTN